MAKSKTSDNSKAGIREVYQLFEKLREDFDDKFDGINNQLITLITTVKGFTTNCEKIQKANTKRIEYENGQFNVMAKLRIKVYGVAAGIAVFSTIIGALVGRFLLN